MKTFEKSGSSEKDKPPPRGSAGDSSYSHPLKSIIFGGNLK
jgi:hypothetical protein